MTLIIRGGLYVPEGDTVCFEAAQREVAHLDGILEHCEDFRTCIQAGGNFGIWPLRLAQQFKRVITFEADPANYEALEANCAGVENIELHHAAVGDDRDNVGIDHITPGNFGAHQIDTSGGDIEVVMIDSLGLRDVDFIQLDIEGFEYFAIEGAINTILECSPLICLEMKECGKRYGYPDVALYQLLDKLGYTIVHKVHRDVIFARE